MILIVTLCTRKNDNFCVKKAQKLFQDVRDYLLKIPGRQREVLISRENT